jgi:phosphoribosyl-ATP pyrophosphohydrolase
MSKENLSLEGLFEIVKNKIKSNEKDSYTAQLGREGLEKITRKVGEEALEVVIAAFMKEKNPSQKRHEELVGEICDLFFHSLVLMAASDVSFAEILAELNKRNQKK